MGGVNTYCTVIDGTNPAPVDIYLIIYRVSYIPEGAGFLPSTVLLYLVDWLLVEPTTFKAFWFGLKGPKQFPFSCEKKNRKLSATSSWRFWSKSIEKTKIYDERIWDMICLKTRVPWNIDSGPLELLFQNIQQFCTFFWGQRANIPYVEVSKFPPEECMAREPAPFLGWKNSIEILLLWIQKYCWTPKWIKPILNLKEQFYRSKLWIHFLQKTCHKKLVMKFSNGFANVQGSHVIYQQSS